MSEGHPEQGSRLLIMNKPLMKEMHTFEDQKETCNQSSPSKKPTPVSL